jgi:hypothetical protein
MARLYLVTDGVELTRRRKLAPRDRLVETWPDLHRRGEFWLGDSSKAVLDGLDGPLPIAMSIDGAAVPIYYGPRLQDLESLPAEESLQTRVLSAHGIAVAWITYDQFGARNTYQPTGPSDPVFYLRRPGASAAHIWRLFRERREARTYMAEFYGRDSEGREWAESLAVESFDDLLRRHGQPEGGGRAEG